MTITKKGKRAITKGERGLFEVKTDRGGGGGEKSHEKVKKDYKDSQKKPD